MRPGVMMAKVSWKTKKASSGMVPKNFTSYIKYVTRGVGADSRIAIDKGLELYRSGDKQEKILGAKQNYIHHLRAVFESYRLTPPT